MTTDGRIKKKKDQAGNSAEVLKVEFTGESLGQLRELARFFEVKDESPVEVVRLGISFLQRIKERHEGPKED